NGTGGTYHRRVGLAAASLGHTRVSGVREVRRRSELENEPPAFRVAPPDLRERVADVAAEHDRPLVRVHDDDLVTRRVPRRRDDTNARPDLRLAVVLDVRRSWKVDPFPDRVVVRGQRVGE